MKKENNMRKRNFWLIYKLVMFLICILLSIILYFNPKDYLLTWLAGAMTITIVSSIIDDLEKKEKKND